MTERRLCVWAENEDGAWETLCDHTFEFTDGGPKDNDAKFCIYCGGELVPVQYSDDDADEEI